METKPFPCSCESDYQDRRYGAGRRLHNRAAVESKVPEWRCTVCGTKRVGT
jgi:hypothetical protein